MLHNADPCAVSDHLSALLEGFDPSHIHSHGCIELQRAAAGGRLGIAEHDADFLSELVDEDNSAVGLADYSGQLTQCL